MRVHYPSASILDSPGLRALVLKAVAWGPPGETLATVAAKLLHGELLAYVHFCDALPGQGRNSSPVLVHGVALLEFDPLGIVVNLAYLAADRGVLAPILDELATLAQGYGFQALECYSRRPGMGKLLGRLGWTADPGAPFEQLPGFHRFFRPL